MSRTRKAASGPRYHRIETVAEKFDLSPRSVRRLIERGALQAVKISGAVRVSDDELMRLLLASRVIRTPDE